MNTQSDYNPYKLFPIAGFPKFTLFNLYEEKDTKNGKLIQRYDGAFHYLDNERMINTVSSNEESPRFCRSMYVKRVNVCDLENIKIFEDYWLEFNEGSRNIVMQNEKNVYLGNFVIQGSISTFNELSLFMYYQEEFYFYDPSEGAWIPKFDVIGPLKEAKIAGFIKL